MLHSIINILNQNVIHLFVSTILVFFLTLALIPYSISFGFRYNIIDTPDGNRRIHLKPIARTGGVVISLCWFMGILVYLYLQKINLVQVLSKHPLVTILLSGGAYIIILGLFDDIFSLRARYKFIAQLILATIIVASLKDRLFPEPISTELLIIYYLFGVFWITGFINAINLSDGMDGLASGISFVISLSLGIYSLIYSQYAWLHSHIYFSCFSFSLFTF